MKPSTKTLICVDKRDLTECIALSLARLQWQEVKYLSDMTMRIVKDIEQMTNNRKGN